MRFAVTCPSSCGYTLGLLPTQASANVSLL